MTNKMIYFPQVGRAVEALAGETILAAALRTGIPFPHGCGAGRCGACKATVVEGRASMIRPFRKDLVTEDEARRGLTLACRSIPTTDVVIAWGEHGRRYRGIIDRVERATHDIARIFVRLADGARFAFEPGQYANLKIGRCRERSYSMASQPD